MGIEEDTLNAEPGPPQNVEVSTYNGTCLSIEWDPPTFNTYCAKGYSTACFPVDEDPQNGISTVNIIFEHHNYSLLIDY